ncbi:type IV toxin-antitoxin system AbiEi family antitoxin [Desulfovibrio sp. UCD-KL4C]|uniref:type IV toxin-antitoxin system AbiEi family antitoxin n=1 Tax=Desulfovibrio sp. UCD-KL4C TaxID=2578120 RepID=UPI0025C6B10A|nr:type IV toxin-antitoxin system AbiEi family antitoxin [Desulfovibrio sp. UCD-KL4C]
MQTSRGTKINHLIQTWPNGTIKDTSELTTLQVNSSLARDYIRQGWLVSVGRGVYAKAHDKLSWLGGLHQLQSSQLPIHAGGRTALELQGHVHYISSQKRDSFLFATPKTKLPAWFKNYDWKQKIVFTMTSLLAQSNESSFTEHDVGTFKVKISAPERAILELLHHVPQKISFDEAKQIMQGLGTLRPALMQTLLEQCNSIKVKRLFLFLAKDASHRWLTHLSRQNINLGSGKREIVKNGMLDKEFNITVPRDHDGELF